MNLFRNFSIKTRLVLSFLISILFPVAVFGYIVLAKIGVGATTTFFLGILSIVIAVVTALMVASSIVSPLHLIQSSLQSFAIKKTSGTLNDKGFDEIADISSDLNKMYEEWNKEVISLGKRQINLDKENEKTNLKASSFELQLEQTRSLLKVAQELNTTFDFQSNCKTILDEAIKAMNVQWASILLLDREHNEMKVACVRGIERSLLDDLTEENYPAIKLKPHEGLAGLVLKERIPLIANKGHKDPRFKEFREFSNRDQKVASLLCAPIIGKEGNILGVMNFVNRQLPPIFRNTDLPYAQDLCTIASLVIERYRMYNSLFTDPRTGLSAYNVWVGQLNEEGTRSVRYAQNLSLLVLDIDNFKQISESTNEDFITDIKESCGKTISRLLRDTDKASANQERYFCLLPNTDASGAVFFAGRVKEALEKEKFNFDNKEINITLSVGIASYPDNTTDTASLLKSALQATMNARKAGGNRAIIFKQESKLNQN